MTWRVEVATYARHILVLLSSGRPAPQFNAHNVSPASIGGWSYEEKKLFVEEGRRQLDRQAADFSQVQTRAQVVLTIGLALAAGWTSALSEVLNGTATAPAAAWLFLILSGILILLAALGATSIIVVRAEFGSIHTTLLTHAQRPGLESLAAAYARTVPIGGNTIATRLSILRYSVFEAFTQPGSATIGVWVHLTATFQKSTGQMVLYVNDSEAATANHPTSWASGGPFQIGDAELNTSGQKYGGYFNGENANVQIWNQVTDPTPTTGPTGHWRLAEGSGTAAADTAGTHPVTLSSTTWTTGRVLGTNAVNANGTTAYGQTSAAITRTDQSFSVAAWVRLTNTTPFATITAQPRHPPIRSTPTTRRRRRLGTHRPTNRHHRTHLRASHVQPQRRRRQHLDPPRRRLQLRGRPDPPLRQRPTRRHHSRHHRLERHRPLNIGREWHDDAYGSYFPGDIDAVHIYQGALSATQIQALSVS